MPGHNTGETAWVVNTLTSNISSYRVATDGTLTLAQPVAAATGLNTGPIDLASTGDGKFVYVLESAVGKLAAYRVSEDSLTPLFTKTGLPLGIQGICCGVAYMNRAGLVPACFALFLLCRTKLEVTSTFRRCRTRLGCPSLLTVPWGSPLLRALARGLSSSRYAGT
jgi:hypothetical protein